MERIISLRQRIEKVLYGQITLVSFGGVFSYRMKEREGFELSAARGNGVPEHPGGEPREGPLLLYWNAFKVGLKYEPVGFGYIAFGGASLLAGTAALVLNTTNFELYLGGPLIILLPTLYRHYREARSYIQARARPVQKP